MREMAGVKSLMFDGMDKHLENSGPMSAYHRHVLSTVLPDAERRFVHMQMKNKTLKKENEVLKRRVEVLTTDAKQLKSEQQRTQYVIKNRDHLRSQLRDCKNELVVLGTKVKIQETELRRGNKQNEVVKEELESTKKELQSVKEEAAKHKAEQQNLKELLDQTIKQRDELSNKWLQCQNECSELRDKINFHKSNVITKDGQCRMHLKEIRLLKDKNLKLEKERTLLESEAEDQRRGRRKCEEELCSQKEKLKENKVGHAFEEQMGQKIIFVQQRHLIIRKPHKDIPIQKTECLRKELLNTTEELKKAQNQRNELKQNLTQAALKLLRCQTVVRHQNQKLKAVTAERNMYQSITDKLGKELEDIKKVQRFEKHQNRLAKRTKKVLLSSGDNSSQSHVSPVSSKIKTGNKLKQSPIRLQEQSDLRIFGKKI